MHFLNLFRSVELSSIFTLFLFVPQFLNQLSAHTDTMVDFHQDVSNEPIPRAIHLMLELLFKGTRPPSRIHFVSVATYNSSAARRRTVAAELDKEARYQLMTL